MYRSDLLLVVVCVAGCLAAQLQPASAPPTPPTKIDASSVWQVTPQFLTTGHAACDNSSHVVECMIDQMAKAGAAPAAVSFTHELYMQSHGDFGIMTGF
ncbi:MAG: hypothetical protein WBE52_19065, partial [Terriglobales bacterium]